MSTKGGGKSPFKQAEQGIRDTGRRWRNDPLGTFADWAVTAASGGTLSYKDGKLTEGPTARNYDEFVGSIDGRNAAREAGYEADKKFKEEQAQREIDLANERLQAYRLDMQASQSAQAARNTSVARSRSLRPSNASIMGNESEFLGL